MESENTDAGDNFLPRPGWPPGQSSYLAIHGIIVLSLLCLAPCLAVFGVANDISYSVAIGIALGFAVVSAACGVLPAFNVFIRGPLSAAAAFCCCFSVFLTFTSGGSAGGDEAVVFSSAPAVAYVLTLFPLIFVRMVFGWRIGFIDPATMPSEYQLRFGIKHLLIVTAVFSVIMGVLRLFAIPLVENINQEMMFFAMVLAVSATCVGFVSIAFSLSTQNLPVAAFGALFLNAIITAIELSLLVFTIGIPRTKFYLIIVVLNMMTMFVVGVALLSLRPIGLRLWTTRGAWTVD